MFFFLDSSLPCFAALGEQTAQQLRDRFQPKSNQQSATELIERLIMSSLGSNWTRLYDSVGLNISYTYYYSDWIFQFQYYSQSILWVAAQVCCTRAKLPSGQCVFGTKYIGVYIAEAYSYQLQLCAIIKCINRLRTRTTSSTRTNPSVDEDEYIYKKMVYSR